jgi:mannose/fructose/N-acetylgalactosamine-specific phosphotransferase system component IIB
MVGNMGSGKDRERVSNTVYMSPAEKKIFEEISDTGCNVYLRMMPKEPAVPFKEIQ